MTMTINRSSRRSTPLSPAQRLQTRFAAVRVSFTWLGVRRSLNPQQKQEAAERFGAEGEYLSAAKKLLDTRHPAYKSVTSIRGRAISYWRGGSLPYPEPGVRLIRQERIEQFDLDMQQLRQELAEAVEALDRSYAELKQRARERLGRLYDEQDYPPTLQGLFDIEWDFPSVEPPDYLLQLNPQLYEQEKNRIAARFEEAVTLAEQAFTSEFARLVSHLTERLSGDVEGKPKVFRDSAISNLTEFFNRFRQLNVNSSADLDRLVEQAQQAVRGVQPQEVRDSDSLRRQLASQLSAVQSQLDQLLVDQPRRKVLRQAPQREG